MSQPVLTTPLRQRPAANRWLAAAAGLSLATCAVHVAFGTPEILEPVLASDASLLAREVTRVCWHLITLTLLAMAGAYAYGLRRRTPALILTWNLLAVAFGIVFVAVAITSGIWFDEMPQSFAFFAIAATGFAGLTRSLYLPSPSEPATQHQPRPLAPMHHTPDHPKPRHRSAH